MNKILKMLLASALALVTLTPSVHAKRKTILKITPIRVYKRYPNRNQRSDQHIILCCQVLIHRRGTPLKLTQLNLKWQPDAPGLRPPQRLLPTLYHPKPKKKFKPINTYMVASGTWDPQQASIHFSLNKKLIGKHRLYIVVHVDEQNAQLLKHGRFVYTDDLPLGTSPIAGHYPSTDHST